MGNYQLFHRYWRDWKAKLDSPIERQSARLQFPEHLDERFNADGSVEFTPPHPILISNAPQKGASNRRGVSHRQMIFIDGSFQLSNASSAPTLNSGRCSLSFFDYQFEASGPIQLEELDALHFDIETSPRPYHPTFHVQRDTSNTLTDQVIQKMVADIMRVEPSAVAVKRASPRSQHLRLPTPQMDMFAVFAMVIADFFCSGGDTDSNAMTQFKAILAHLTNARNLARGGIAARALQARACDVYACPAHWYPEYC